MKNCIVLLFICLANSLTIWSQPIVNNSFETPLDKNLEFGWSISSDTSFLAIDTISISGDFSLKIENNTLMKPIFVQQTVAIPRKADHVIDLSFYTKCKDMEMGYGGVSINSENNHGNVAYRYNMNDQRQNGTLGWHKVSIPIFADSSFSKVIFGPMLAGHGTIWYDDFLLAERTVSTGEYISEMSEFMVILKKLSLYKDNFSSVIESKYMNYTRFLQTDLEVNRLKNKLLIEIGDNHAFIKNTVHITQNQTQKRHSPNHILNVAVIRDNYGYLKIPAFRGSENTLFAKEYSQNLIDNLNLIQQGKVDTLILDLRFNSGGNMWPMLKGISILLDEDHIGMFLYPGNKKEMWKIQNSNDKSIEGSNNDDYLRKIPIIVLIGKRTASSGEAIAIALKGRRNTVLIGGKTRGLTTALVEFPITKDKSVHLATSYMADNEGNKYVLGVEAENDHVQNSFSESLRYFLKEMKFE
ncbi:MAG: S41 family peptidase [Reichenbachiella sp.]